ncbi:MAG: NAD-dependent epimerase/dehydratase family protein [Vulcanimicrobiaceae bacterium]
MFVTGATGTCGRFVVRELLSRGYEVIAHSRMPTQIDGCINAPAELYAIGTQNRHIRSSDGIIHLASTRQKRRNAVITSDIIGTGALIDLWQRGPFVYASSQMVYGLGDEPKTEQTPVDPTSSWYDMGKYVCEFQLSSACDRNGRGAGIALRVPAVLSASRSRGQTLDMLYRDMMRGATFVFDSEETLETAGSDYISGPDLGKAYASALAISASGPYNVATGYFTWKALLEGLAQATGAKGRYMVGKSGTVGGLEARLPQRRSRLDTSRFKSIVHTEAGETVEQILAEFAARIKPGLPSPPEDEPLPDLGT